MKEILIIKLGAIGDVVRTLPILSGIKEKYPGSRITWFTLENSKSLIEANPKADVVITDKKEVKKEYDILYNFDIEDLATSLAKNISSKRKYGFFKEGSFPMAFNFSSEYYLNTLFDDDLKKSNEKTYQEMMFEVAELEWKKQPIEMNIPKKDQSYAKKFIEENKIPTKNLIGIHLGAGPRWPSKKWHKDNLKEFIRKATSKKYNILLFGGVAEEKEHNELFNSLLEEKIKIYRNDPKNSVLEFAALVSLCSQMICSDSLSLHISIATKRPTIGLFFCTPSKEIEGYGFLESIISPMVDEFFPERMDEYSEDLVKSISPKEVLEKIKK